MAPAPPPSPCITRPATSVSTETAKRATQPAHHIQPQPGKHHRPASPAVRSRAIDKLRACESEEKQRNGETDRPITGVKVLCHLRHRGQKHVNRNRGDRRKGDEHAERRTGLRVSESTPRRGDGRGGQCRRRLGGISENSTGSQRLAAAPIACGMRVSPALAFARYSA